MEDHKLLSEAVQLCFVIFLGLCSGSFSSALIYRIPQKLNWVSERSKCPKCHHDLGVFDLIPVFSWVFSRGKCRYCCVAVSSVYPILECCAAFAAVVVYLRFGLGGEGLIILAALPFLQALLMIDLKHYILPNQLNIILFALGVGRLALLYGDGGEIFPFIIGALVFAAVSWAIGFIMKTILKKEALGLGDVKFFMVAGLWLGLDALPMFMAGAGVFGVVFGALWQKITKSRLFPFGPALIISFYIVLLYQGSLFM